MRALARAFLALSLCASSANADTFTERWRAALRKGTIPSLDEFDFAGREFAYRGTYWTLAMGSSIAQLDVQFGASLQIEVPAMEVYLAAPGMTARVLESVSALAIPLPGDALMTKLRCLKFSLRVALGGDCSASNAPETTSSTRRSPP